jgi:hypothetical protein
MAATIKDLKAKIKALPVTLAAEVAKQGAPLMTQLTDQAFDGGRTVYDDARPLGVDGQALSLKKSGRTRSQMRFERVGTRIRCVLPSKYARYLIGKYSILPNGALPVHWARALTEIVKKVRP